METPLSLTFQDIDHSDAVEQRVHAEFAKIERVHDRITSCRVVIARTKSRGRHGHLYQARVELGLPDAKDVMVTRDPGRDAAHEDVYVAIRDAFAAARRQLGEHVEQRGHKGRHHG